MESCVGTRDRFRTLQAKRPEANPKTTAFAVCRKAAGMPGRVETPSSYCQPYSVHTQSIFSPRRGPRSVHVRGSTSPWTSWDPVAFNVKRSSQGHGGESRGLSRAMRSPMPPLPERPDGLPGMAGARDNLRQLVEQRTPSVVDDGGFNGADNVRENPLSGRIGLFHLDFTPHAHPGRISGPPKKGRGGLRPGP
jgi:hypothetical protein